MIEVDEEMIQGIAESVIASPGFTQALQQAFTDFQAQLNTSTATLTQQMTDLMRTNLEPVTQRMAALEAENAEQVAITRADAPRRATDTKLRMTVRPRDRHAEEVVLVEESYADIAARTLATFPQSPTYS